MTPRSSPNRDRPASRYAVYIAPEPGSLLAQFGRAWLGYDPETGRPAERETFGLDPGFVERITAAPAVYGLHATVKAPFRLSGRYSVEGLKARLDRFAANRRRFSVGRLTVRRLGNFLALMPERTEETRWLVAQCTFGFDAFRAPLSAQERARRLSDALTPHQKVLLGLYGYPFVLGEYRFHVTLTGPLSEEERAIAEPALQAALKPILSEPLEIASLCLFAQPVAGAPFRLVARCPLRA